MVYDPRVSSSLVGHLVGAVNGASIARKTSFLKDKLGQKLFADHIRIIDDPLRVRGLRSQAFDAEGVKVKALAIIDQGVLTSWLLDCATARELGMIAGQGKPVLRARFKADESSLAALRGKRALAFAGIGDPARFFATLRDNGIDVASTQIFPDHHPLTPDEAANLVSEANSGGLTLVTTEKDLARLRSPEGLPDWARSIVPLKVTLAFDDAAALRRFVSAQLFKAREVRRKP